jgi:hypothetical protein
MTALSPRRSKENNPDWLQSQLFFHAYGRHSRALSWRHTMLCQSTVVFAWRRNVNGAYMTSRLACSTTMALRPLMRLHIDCLLDAYIIAKTVYNFVKTVSYENKVHTLVDLKTIFLPLVCKMPSYSRQGSHNTEFYQRVVERSSSNQLV